jgi:L-ascorbate metabolism protein UlaG (beta-lactamase superfamily)
MRHALALALLCAACGSPAPSTGTTPATPASPDAAKTPPTAPPADADTFETSAGPLKIHPVQHATLWLEAGDKIVWVDPWSKADLTGPKADIILVTDIHGDHFDADAIATVRKPDTKIIAPKVVTDKFPDATPLANGETTDLGIIRVEAIPMYNLTRGPEPGKLYHDRGRGNGYVLTVGDKRLYISGDTECTPEMKALKNIDIAFVCMNLPYTMPPTEAAECVAAFNPKILYPYHYRESNLDDLSKPLATTSVEIRRRDWY